ncbi:hypothetical protein OPV22_019042 [Ensete ventricosum]|uniref:Uncharacterized protein n=1 Tax=Ensete ventricosum TaxID=4639 RepID=A0AAV8QVJ9_ENSVE|nr:hypothetical protein OPV22_019042 [Ensete ventricosum]
MNPINSRRSCLPPQPKDASRSTQATTTALQENHPLGSLHCSPPKMITRAHKLFTKCVEASDMEIHLIAPEL